MSEDTLASDVDTASKMITEAAAPDVQFIFGAAFKEDMQDEMTITVIAADFESDNGRANFQSRQEEAKKLEETKAAVQEEVDDEFKSLEKSLLDDKMDYGQPAAPRRQDNDIDMNDIFSILGGN